LTLLCIIKNMKVEIAERLLQINTVFYQNFGPAFAATRRRIQPGIRRVLESLPRSGNWLDLGCGSGALALEWVAQGRTGAYTGLDFSAALLAEARRGLQDAPHPGLEIAFYPANLGTPSWPTVLNGRTFDGVLAFASLHHIPGEPLRLSILQQVRRLLPPGGQLIHSEWQFQHSPRLLARVLPWQEVGLNPLDLEPGDTLLDWRYALPGQSEEVGLRYVHRFDRPELARLAAGSGFTIVDEFESDGEGDRLGLYQVWQAG
jgi:tRNA (uracil-5-)-methyltransferase TRM9